MSSLSQQNQGQVTVSKSLVMGGMRLYVSNWAGTLGCIVNMNGVPHLLTNAHVLSFNLPGPVKTIRAIDGPIAQTSHWKDKKSFFGARSFMDAGLARLISGVRYTYDITGTGIGVPRGHTEPVKGMRVKMYGSTTKKVTTASIVNTNLSYKNRDGTVVNNVIEMDAYMGPGDSGSIVMNDQGYVVGLFFGQVPPGMNGKQIPSAEETTRLFNTKGFHTVACKASTILAQYPGLSFVGKPGIYTATSPYSSTSIVDLGTPAPRATTPTPTPTPTPTSVPTVPRDPISALLQAIMNFINSLLGGTK